MTNPEGTDLERLRALAEKATPGPYRVFIPDKGYTMDYVVTDHPDFARTKEAPWRHLICECDSNQNPSAAYIAACCPSIIIALIARCLAAEKERDEARARIDEMETDAWNDGFERDLLT